MLLLVVGVKLISHDWNQPFALLKHAVERPATHHEPFMPQSNFGFVQTCPAGKFVLQILGVIVSTDNLKF